jgi:hypothetical protein
MSSREVLQGFKMFIDTFGMTMTLMKQLTMEYTLKESQGFQNLL